MDRLLISFKDAKVHDLDWYDTASAHLPFCLQISLMEWNDFQYDLTTVSIHTYERAPQVLTSTNSSWRSTLRVESLYRCAALSLPKDAIAILPFHSNAELELMENEHARAK